MTARSRYKTLSRPFRRLLNYTPQERVRITWLMAHIVRIDFLLRYRGFQETRRQLSNQRPRLSLFVGLEPSVTSRFVDSAARYTIGSRQSCLRRSLLLWWLLNKQGMVCEARIGIMLSEGRLKGHAWVEVDGQVVNDDADVRERFNRLQLSASDI